MDLTDYPNLQAVFDGRVSRAHDEWPQVRVELRQLLNAATARERLLVDQKALTENAWKVANDQARQREAMERRVEEAEQKYANGVQCEADLQSRLALWKESADSMKACWHAACHDIARLEEEKAQADQMLQEAGALVCEGNSLLEKALADGCTYLMKYAQAEAREAAMREALVITKSALIEYMPLSLRTHNQRDPIVIATKALSPDDGRALATEVEKLREVAKWADRVSETIMGQFTCEGFEELRDALAKQQGEQE